MVYINRKIKCVAFCFGDLIFTISNIYNIVFRDIYVDKIFKPSPYVWSLVLDWVELCVTNAVLC